MYILIIYFLNLIADIIYTFFYKKNIDFYLKSKIIKEFFFKFQELIIFY